MDKLLEKDENPLGDPADSSPRSGSSQVMYQTCG